MTADYHKGQLSPLIESNWNKTPKEDQQQPNKQPLQNCKDINNSCFNYALHFAKSFCNHFIWFTQHYGFVGRELLPLYQWEKRVSECNAFSRIIASQKSKEYHSL